MSFSMNAPVACVAILAAQINESSNRLLNWLAQQEGPIHLLIEWRLLSQQADWVREIVEGLAQRRLQEPLKKPVLLPKFTPESSVDLQEVEVSPLLRLLLVPAVDSQGVHPAVLAIQHARAHNCGLLHFVLDERPLYCADPVLVPEALHLDELAFEEAAEIFSFSKGQLTRQALAMAQAAEMTVAVYDVQNLQAPPTSISANPSPDSFGVRALVVRRAMGLLNISTRGAAGFAAVLQTLEAHGIFPEFISSSVADDTCTLAVDGQLLSAAAEAVTALGDDWLLQVPATQFSTVGIIGSHMRHRAGVSGKIFETLGKNGVSVSAIAQSSSELAISLLMRDEDTKKALICLHDALFLSARNRLHLMLVGPGSIGSELLKQIENHAGAHAGSRTSISMIGITNRRNTLFDPEGISFERWDAHRNKAEQHLGIAEALKTFVGMNLPNSVVIDCTASDELPNHYDMLLAQSISVVTPNKRGLCGPSSEYVHRHATARRHNAKWYYETTVGAGLPIIGTIHDLLGSGDRILQIEAILSGTLSFLWNTYDAEESFAQLVRKAQAQGITEPDPRDDLNGTDVARKLLILAREAGRLAEIEDVEVVPPVPLQCLQTGSIDAFYESLEQAESEIADRYHSATAAGQRLRYLAVMRDDSLRVALQPVGPDHPAYALCGTDNILSISTERYHAQPLVIRGPGAGVSVTAAGVFADVLRVASFLE